MAEKSFQIETDMIDSLIHMDETDIKSINYIDEASLTLIADECPILDPESVAKAFGISVTDEEAVEEAINTTGCIWKGPVDGMMRAVPVAEVAIQSLCGRAGLYGPSIKIKPTILNDGYVLHSRTEENKTKLLIRDGRLIASHSNKLFEEVIRYKVLPYLLEQTGEHNFRVEKDSRMYCHGNPDYAFARADIDGVIQMNGKLGIVEIKTTNWRNVDTIEMWKAGVVPPYYEAQCRHYMAVLNLDFVYICCAWGFNPQTEAVLIRIDRNDSLEQQIMDTEREFWEKHVEFGFPVEEEACSPSVARGYYCSRMVRNKNETPVILDENALIPLINERNLLLSRIKLAKGECAAAQEELDSIELSIMQALGNNCRGIYMKDATHRVTVEANNKLENRTFDLDAIRKNCPDLYDKAVEIKFSVSKLSSSEQAKLKQYQLPQKPNGKVEVKVWETELDANGSPIKKKHVMRAS